MHKNELKNAHRSELKKDALTFLIGAAGYSLIEILARGHTHWTMTLTGGACLLAIRRLNRRFCRAGLFFRALMGAAVITSAELFVGLVVNRLLGWGVWDYSDRAMNLLGQICPRFSLYWFLLCLPVSAFFMYLQGYSWRPCFRLNVTENSKIDNLFSHITEMRRKLADILLSVLKRLKSRAA